MRTLVPLVVLSTLACAEPEVEETTASAAPTAVEPEPEPEREPEPKFEWDENSLWPELVFLEPKNGDFETPTIVFEIEATAANRPVELVLTLGNMPSGTVVAIGENQTESREGRGKLRIPLPKAHELSMVDVVARRVDVGLPPVTVNFARYQPVAIPVPKLAADLALAKIFKQVVDRPIRFAGEGEDKRIDGAAVIHPNTIDFVGSAKTLAGIDWIAVTTKQEVGRRKCSGYSGTDGPIEVILVGRAVAIHERRTGKRVAETVLKPRGCPVLIFPEDGVAETSISDEPVVAWVRRRLRKRR